MTDRRRRWSYRLDAQLPKPKGAGSASRCQALVRRTDSICSSRIELQADAHPEGRRLEGSPVRPDAGFEDVDGDVDAGPRSGCGRRRSSRDPRSRAGVAGRRRRAAQGAQHQDHGNGQAHRRNPISPSAADRCPAHVPYPASPRHRSRNGIGVPLASPSSARGITSRWPAAGPNGSTNRGARRRRRSRAGDCPRRQAQPDAVDALLRPVLDTWGGWIPVQQRGRQRRRAVRGSVLRTVEADRRRQPDRHVPVRAGRLPADEGAAAAGRPNRQQRIDLGDVAAADSAAYVATKHGVSGLTKSLRPRRPRLRHRLRRRSTSATPSRR